MVSLDRTQSDAEFGVLSGFVSRAGRLRASERIDETLDLKLAVAGVSLLIGAGFVEEDAAWITVGMQTRIPYSTRCEDAAQSDFLDE